MDFLKAVFGQLQTSNEMSHNRRTMSQGMEEMELKTGGWSWRNWEELSYINA